MVTFAQGASNSQIQALTGQSIQQGCLRRRDHVFLTSAMLGDPSLSSIDRSQINRVLDYVRMGRIELID